MDSVYWVNNVYGFGKGLRDYACFPTSLPLCNYMDHGMTLSDAISPHEIETDAPVIFKFSPRLVKEYKKVSKKPVYCLQNPSIYYRVKNNIKPLEQATGTLFFVAHSTPEIDDHTNWEKFIDGFNSIPEQFKPIDICLHHHDIVKGLDRIFSNRGFKIYTAGNPYASDYMEKFYRILSRYKFTMSNLIGSYAFYSVEMRIPFSFYGEEPIYFNKSDKNIESGSYTSYKNQPTYQKAVMLFRGYYTEINQGQLDFVNTELGKNDSIGRVRACLLLFKALFMYTLMHPNTLKSTVKGAINVIKHKIKTKTSRLFLK